ncbi:MAG: ABC transporter substrate-binding protein [Alphaproteobacteria bacterium]
MSKLTRRVSVLAAGVFAAAIGVAPAAWAEVPESSDPIKLAVLEWTGQHVTTYMAGQILERMGYTVEYPTAGSYPSGQGTADGDLTATLEVWDNNMGEYWPKVIEEGKVENLGHVGLDGGEGFVYPKYVEEMCPGLPAWDAFVGCAELFATPETLPNGRFVDYPADWGDRATQLFRAQGLPFDAVPAGSEGALVAELKSAVEKHEPVVLMFWAPHFILAQIEVGWVDMPEDLRNEYSMQKPLMAKFVWSGMKDKWPAAYNLVKTFQIDTATQQVLMDLVDNQGQDVREVTSKWLDEHEDVWRPWVDQAMM